MILVIKIYLACWFFTNFELAQNFMTWFATKARRNWLTQSIYGVFTCQYCLTFWSLLAITLNPFIAFAGAMVAQIHKKYLES